MCRDGGLIAAIAAVLTHIALAHVIGSCSLFDGVASEISGVRDAL